MSKFGWCVTGHHDQCRTSYYDDWSLNKGERVCSCECHSETKSNVDTEQGIEEAPKRTTKRGATGGQKRKARKNT